MFRLPNPPSPRAETNELADFAEIISWKRGQVSKRELLSLLNRLDDCDLNEGCNDGEDEYSDQLDEVMNEFERREDSCGNGYPFSLDLEGTVLKDNKSENQRDVIYKYLLLCTRLNMKDNRTHANIDGALLLEEVSAHVLKNLLGGTRAKSLVFGTSYSGNFIGKINKLCQELREGSEFRNLDEAPPTANDDKLDAVAWVPFSDQLSGQVIIFAQCKTGSSWRELSSQLQPDSFTRKWLRDPLVVLPIRAFCISESADRARWNSTGLTTGLMLDRCRLVDFSDGMSEELIDRISKWTNSAKQFVDQLVQ